MMIKINIFLTLFLLLVSFGLTSPMSDAAEAPPTAKTASPKVDPARDRFDFADGLYAREMYDMAALEYKDILSDYPDHPRAADANFRLAESFFTLEKSKQALSHYQKFLAKFPEHTQRETAQLRIAETLSKLGKVKEAIQTLTPLTASKDLSRRQTAQYLTGKMLFEDKKHSEAKLHFEAIQSPDNKNPFWDVANYYLGEIAVAEQKFSAATNHFKEAQKSEKKHIRQLAFFGLGQSSFLMNEFDQAKNYFMEAGAIGANKEIREDAFINYLKSVYETKDYEEIIETHDMEKLTDPSKIYSVNLLVTNSHFQLRQFDEAVALYDKTLKLKPLSKAQIESAQLGKIEALLAARKAKAALSFSESLPKKKQHFQDRWLYLLAEIMNQNKQFDKALENLVELLDKFPDSEYRAQTLLNRGYIYLNRKKFQEARDSFDIFLKEYPEHKLAEQTLMNRITLDIKLEKWEDAESDSLAFLEKFPKSKKAESIHYQLGSVYIQLKQYAKANSTYKKHLKNYKPKENKHEVFFFLGYTRQLEGKLRSAVDYYEKIDKSQIGKDLYLSTLKNKAYSYIQVDNYDKAAKSYFELVSDFPKSKLQPDIYFWLANYYLKKSEGRHILTIMESFQLQPEKENHLSEFYYFSGEGYRLTEQDEKAIKSFDACLEQPRAYEALALLGKSKSLARIGEFDQAITLLERTIKIASEDYQTALSARFELARVFGLREDFVKSAKAYLAIAILYEDPKMVPEALDQAGHHFKKAHRFKEAKMAYGELIDRYPDHDLTLNAKEHIQEIDNALEKTSV